LGYDPKTRLTPLTVNLGEFAEQINAENREILQFGWFFQWNVRTRREHNVPSGPVNPQALNRYAYVLNNPLRYIDPTGHYLINNIDVDLTAEQVQALLSDIDQCLGYIDQMEVLLSAADFVSWVSTMAGMGSIAAEYMINNPGVLLRVEVWANLIGPYATIMGALGIAGVNSVTNTKDDLNALRYALAMASAGGQQGVHLRMGSNFISWGIEVNKQEIVGHLNLPLGVPGMMWSKGQANLTPTFMQAWWQFHY